MDGDNIVSRLESKWLNNLCPQESWRNGRGWTEGGRFWLKLSFQRDAVFGDDKVQCVSNRVRMEESRELRVMGVSRN